jgi:alpha-tubulin suppressor-like RCC1 family protein
MDMEASLTDFCSSDSGRSRLLTLTLATIAALATTLVLAANASALATPQVATSTTATCALLDTGAVKCWGNNNSGQLGNGSFDNSITPVDVTGLADVVDVANGSDTACALLADRTVRCWGSDGDGALGDAPGKVDSNVPVAVAGLTNVIQLSGTRDAFCALVADGTVQCWGDNDYYQFGTGDSNDRETPVVVPGIANAVKVIAGYYNVCALIADGSVKCLGDNDSGQLGDPAVSSGVDSQTAVTVVGLAGATDLSGTREHFCAIVAAGAVKCWGSNWDGELGNGDSTLTSQPSPVDVVGLTGATALSDGRNSVCALLNDGTVKCWGANAEGQLGIGGGGPSIVPVAVPGLSAVRGISDQSYESRCAWMAGGAVHCWGLNDYGQLGNPDLTFKALAPVAVPGVDLVTLPYVAAATAIAQSGKTKLDRKKKNYSVTTQLTVTPNRLLAPAEACNGTATLSAARSYFTYKTVKLKGKKVRKRVKKTTTYKKSAPVTLVGETCVSTVSLKLPVKFFNGKKLKFTHTTTGNGSIRGVTKTKTIKLPKVKSAKKRK